MKYIQHFKLFESKEVLSDLSDLVLDIKDLDDWNVQFWENKWGGEFTGDYTVIIETEDTGSSDYKWVFKQVPVTVIETINTLIGYFKDLGYDYKISFEADDTDEFRNIDISDIKNLDVWSNNFIRVQFNRIVRYRPK